MFYIYKISNKNDQFFGSSGVKLSFEIFPRTIPLLRFRATLSFYEPEDIAAVPYNFSNMAFPGKRRYYGRSAWDAVIDRIFYCVLVPVKQPPCTRGRNVLSLHKSPQKFPFFLRFLHRLTLGLAVIRISILLASFERLKRDLNIPLYISFKICVLAFLIELSLE